MNVLITGGLGFIGSHVAGRFLKEGHSVVVLDDLSAGRKESWHSSYRFYRMSTTDSACEDLFRGNHFDAVIHLAAADAEGSDMAHGTPGEAGNHAGLLNLLELSDRYDVRQFLIASSTEVYGAATGIVTEKTEPAPVTALGVDRYIAETYCSVWHKTRGIGTVAFRFGQAYGPGQKSAAPEPPAETAADVPADRQADLIYVDDVADAFYKAVAAGAQGVFNLSGSGRAAGDGTDSEDTGGEAVIDCTKAAKILHWKAKYSLQEGLEKTEEWARPLPRKQKRERKAANWFVRYALPFLENGAVFAGILYFGRLWLNGFENAIFFYVTVCYVYICVFAVLYGMWQSLLSVALSAAVYLLVTFQAGNNLISVLYDPASILSLGGYIAVGLIMGYFTDAGKRKLALKSMEMETLQEKYNLSNFMLSETQKVKNELENQIISSQNSLGSLYEATRALDTLDLEQVYSASITVVERLMQTGRVSLYALNSDKRFLRLKAKSNEEGWSLPYSVELAKNAAIKQVVEKKTVFVNRDLKEHLPLMVAPVINQDDTVALLSVYDFKFENLTLHFVNLFTILSNLIAAAVSRAIRFDEVMGEKRYVRGTDIYLPAEFERVLQQKRQFRRQSGIDFTLLQVRDGSLENDPELYHNISTSIRDNDRIGLGSDKMIYIVLSNTAPANAVHALDRLHSRGVRAEVVSAGTEA